MDTTEPKATFLGEGSSDLEGRGSLYPARGDGARLSKPGVKVAFSLIFPNPKCVFLAFTEFLESGGLRVASQDTGTVPARGCAVRGGYPGAGSASVSKDPELRDRSQACSCLRPCIPACIQASASSSHATRVQDTPC